MQVVNHKAPKDLNKIIIFIGVLSMAVVTRIVYFNDFQYNPFSSNVYYYTDSIHYYIGGQNFASGDILALSPSNKFSPLYTYFIGLLFKVAGTNLTNIWAVQFLLGALTVLLVYQIALELINARAAIIAAILYNFYGPALMYEGTLLRVSLLTFLGTLSLYLIIQVLNHPNRLLIVLAGISISLFIQCRPNVALIFVLLPLSYLFPFERQKLQIILKIGFVALLFFIPLLLRGWIVHGKFILFDASGATAFLIGNHPDYMGGGLSAKHEHSRGLSMGFGEMISIFQDRIVQQPLEMLGLYFRKLFYMFSSLEHFNNYDFLLFRNFSPLLTTPFSNFSLISSLALTGLIFKIGKRKNIKLLYSFIIGITAAIVIFYILARFRIVAAPFYAILAGFTLDSCWVWLKDRQWIKSAQVLIVFLFFMILFNIPQFVRGKKQPYSEEINYLIGMNLVAGKRYNQAIEYLREYLKTQPENVQAGKALALAFRKKEDERHATQVYKNIVALKPDDAGAHFNLANLYANKRDWEKTMTHMSLAQKNFDREKNIEWRNISQEKINQIRKKEEFNISYYDVPRFKLWNQIDHPEGINYQVGLHSMYSRRYPEAIEAFNQHLQYHPEHVKTYKALALAFFKIGKLNQSIQTYEKLTSYMPEDSGANFDLATLYAKSKNWDKAILYMEAAKNLFHKNQDYKWERISQKQIIKYSEQN